MRLEEGLDTGGIYAEERVPIGANTTADQLRGELNDVGCRLLVDVLSQPFSFNKELARFATPPRPEQEVRQTFCGT